jgi:hypothetical protein
LYNVRWHKPKSLNWSACTIKENYYSNFIFYKAPLLKIWDNVDFLIDKDIYDIISGEKILNWEYNFSYYYSSSWNFEICEPNVWEDTELQKKIRDGHKYLNELYDKKPKLVKSLLEPLRQAILSDKLELEIRNLASAFWKIVYNF